MDLKDFKIGLLEKTELNEEMIRQFGDDNLKLLLPLFDKFVKNNKEESGYITLALFIGLKLNGYDKEGVINVFKEATNNKKYVDKDEAEWLLKRIKLGI